VDRRTNPASGNRSGLYYGWVIVGVALIMNLAASPTNPVVFSFFIGPMAEDLGWSRSSLAWAFTFRMAAAGITSPILGKLVDRYGSRWLGAGAGALAGLALIGLSFTHNVWYLYLIFAISGVSGFGGPGGALLTAVPTAKWFRAKRGRAIAIAGVGMPAGTVMFIPLSQWLIGAVGWRDAWTIFGIMVIALVVPLCILFMRRQPEDMGLLPDGGLETPAAAMKRRRHPEATTEEWTVGEALHQPVLYLLLAGMVLSGLALNGTLVHRVAFFTDLGISPAMVAFATAMDPFTVIFSSLFFGVIAERVRLRYLGLIAGAGWAISMLPMVFATANPAFILAHNLIWGFSAGAHITVNNLAWPNYFGTRHLGTIRGIAFPLSIGAAGVGAPVFGILLDGGLATTTVWLISLSLFAATGLSLFMTRAPKKPQPNRPELVREPAART
jgi:MFS family permease